MFDKSNSNTFLSDMTLCASATVNLDYETVFFWQITNFTNYMAVLKCNQLVLCNC